MRALLDTQVFLWAQAGDRRLPRRFKRVLDDPRAELFLSSASAWEIVIKHAQGKLPLPEPPSSYLPSRMALSRLRALDVTHAHVLAVGELPPLHADPFDRVLIAQARIEDLPFLTADDQLDGYDFPRLRR